MSLRRAVDANNKIETINATEDQLLNRFINYYIIKWFWIKNKRQVEELYIDFFINPDTGKGNKTLYDRILRLEQVEDIEKKINKLPNKTGLHRDYFLGGKALPIQGITKADWENYVSLSAKRKNSEKTHEQFDLENRIQINLSEVYYHQEKRNQPLDIIKHYTETLKKSSDDTCLNRINKIEVLINEFTRRELEKVDPTKLEEYEKKIIFAL